MKYSYDLGYSEEVIQVFVFVKCFVSLSVLSGVKYESINFHIFRGLDIGLLYRFSF